MMRAALLFSASLLAFSVAAHAQTPGAAAPPPAPTPASQLDRIEQNLDEVLRRLDQPHSPPAGTVQGAAGAIPSPAPTVTPAASPEAYKPGALAIILAAPRDPNGLDAATVRRRPGPRQT